MLAKKKKKKLLPECSLDTANQQLKVRGLVRRKI